MSKVNSYGLKKKESNLGAPKVIRFKTHFTNTIYDVLRDRGYKQTDSETDWDFHWADVGWIREVLDHIHLEDHQRVNHFRNHYELTRKDLLVKNLKRMKRQLEKEDKKAEAKKFDFCPQSFIVPSEYSMFAEEFKKNPGVYIMKPIGKAQGKGIFLFNKLHQISDWRNNFKWGSNANDNTQQAETYIVQKYLDRPFLVGGRKFDLRLYVLVTSYMPLTVYLNRAGFARFSQFKFSMNPDEIDNNYIHLTNVAIQKTTIEYAENDKGCKWDLRQLKLYMLSLYSQEEVDSCFTLIEELILRSLFAVQKVIIQDKHCFEMYGYDILIDEDLKPWLLEVNASPSLTADTQEDYDLKTKILNDMLTVVDMEKKLTGNEVHIGGFDLICRTSKYEKAIPTGSRAPSLLGAFNDREKNLKKLMKKTPKK